MPREGVGIQGGIQGELQAPPSQLSSGRIDPFAERRANLRRHLERAREWQQLIAAGKVENAAQVAAAEGLTRARVSQVLKLLSLSPAVLEEIEDPARSGPVPTERQLRALAAIGLEAMQLKKYKALLETLRRKELRRRDALAFKGMRQRGFQFAFEKARQLRALYSSGRFVSLRELGEEVGLTPERVGQLLNLLELAPELIEILDVPVKRLPEGFSSGDLRKLAKLRDHEAQRKWFESWKLETHPGYAGEPSQPRRAARRPD